MEQEVLFFGLRHGHRLNGGDKLSPLGFRQIEASVQRHLPDVAFDAAFHSPYRRTRQALVHVIGHVAASKFIGVKPVTCPGLGFGEEQSPDVPVFDYDRDRDRIAAAKTNPSRPITVWDMLVGHPPMWFYRGQMQATLRDLAHRVAMLNATQRLFHALLTGHTPVIESATLHPRTQPELDLADMVRYRVRVPASGFPTIIETVHLVCPPIG